ncbi:MAG TPA: response regulator, partial [Chthoniobacteraceae bacterium]
AFSLTDGNKALGWLEANPCDAIILDIGMPKIDGLSLISMIREKFAELPIVMFTGLGYDEEAMQKARKAGANGYVSKGLGPSEIYSALMRVLGQLNRPATKA